MDSLEREYSLGILDVSYRRAMCIVSAAKPLIKQKQNVNTLVEENMTIEAEIMKNFLVLRVLEVVFKFTYYVFRFKVVVYE